MKIEHIQRYAGIPVIVQLRDAMALGKQHGPMQAAPVCNEKGELLKKDGTVAPPDVKQDEVAFRPVWRIQVRQDEKGGAEFRFAIEDAIVSVIRNLPDRDEDLGQPSAAESDAYRKAVSELFRQSQADSREPALVVINYTENQTLYELAVEPDAIVGITCVRQGPMPEERSNLIQPGRN